MDFYLLVIFCGFAIGWASYGVVYRNQLSRWDPRKKKRRKEKNGKDYFKQDQM